MSHAYLHSGSFIGVWLPSTLGSTNSSRLPQYKAEDLVFDAAQPGFSDDLLGTMRALNSTELVKLCDDLDVFLSLPEIANSLGELKNTIGFTTASVTHFREMAKFQYMCEKK